MRARYWSCSKFADWLRGAVKPQSATMTEWKAWDIETKAKYPVRYWIAEEGLDFIQNTINWPADQLNNIRYYINNRWISKSHALTAHPRDIKPGAWADVGNRFLPCLFNELVDFVEIETAWHHCLFDKEARVKYSPPWWRRGWLRWRTWRCAPAGVAYLDWAASLTMDESWGIEPTDEDYGQPTHQAVAAREVLALYTWWKQVYANRPDPYDASGWTAICEQHGKDFVNIFDDSALTPQQNQSKNNSLELLHKIEEDYEREDTEMLIRLIKIRKGLWT
jgi:hypothetical protein